MTTLSTPLNLTPHQNHFLSVLMNYLYGEEGYSNVEVSEISQSMGIPLPQSKGILGSLVKRGILTTFTEDVNGEFYEFIHLHPNYYHLHPQWKVERLNGWSKNFWGVEENGGQPI
jgi:DNA-binding MarR family transcriptional regulator